MYLFLRAHVNTLSTAPSSWCFNPLSVLLNSWKIFASLLCVSVSALIWEVVAPRGMMGIGLRFTGGTNSTRDKVLKTVFEMVIHNMPKVSFPRWLLTEAVLVLRNSFSFFSVSKDGYPRMGVMVGREKPSMIFSEDDMFWRKGNVIQPLQTGVAVGCHTLQLTFFKVVRTD